MYRCTECNKVYEEYPDYCDCGNDEFEEFEAAYYEQPVKQHVPRIKKAAPKLSPEEQEEYDNELADKKNALIVIIVSIFIAIGVLFLPPYRQKKIEKVTKQVKAANIKLPAVNTFWDDAIPSKYSSKDPLSGLPLLNEKFKTASETLKKYLISTGRHFNNLWEPGIVKGTGECKILFVIDKEGKITHKKIIMTSNNESLDDSVLILLTKITNLDVPPDDYKGEKIYLSFKIDKNGSSKVYYPMH